MPHFPDETHLTPGRNWRQEIGIFAVRFQEHLMDEVSTLGQLDEIGKTASKGCTYYVNLSLEEYSRYRTQRSLDLSSFFGQLNSRGIACEEVTDLEQIPYITENDFNNKVILVVGIDIVSINESINRNN